MQAGHVASDSVQRCLDAFAYRDAGTLIVRAGSPFSAMQAGGAREFLREEIDLPLQDLDASQIVVGLGLGEFSAGLREAAPKRLQRLLVQNLQPTIIGNREVPSGQIGLRRRIRSRRCAKWYCHINPLMR